MSYRHTIGTGGEAVTIRRARPADATALRQLAALDHAVPLDGEVLVAEVDGELWAALDLDGARTISDPFRPAADARALLELRAASLRTANGHRATSLPMSFGWLRGQSS
jgi:hypothetical protein